MSAAKALIFFSALICCLTWGLFLVADYEYRPILLIWAVIMLVVFLAVLMGNLIDDYIQRRHKEKADKIDHPTYTPLGTDSEDDSNESDDPIVDP